MPHNARANIFNQNIFSFRSCAGSRGKGREANLDMGVARRMHARRRALLEQGEKRAEQHARAYNHQTHDEHDASGRMGEQRIDAAADQRGGKLCAGKPAHHHDGGSEVQHRAEFLEQPHARLLSSDYKESRARARSADPA